jgi:hypothetical protein
VSGRRAKPIEVSSREAAVRGFYEAGLRIMWRPHVPGDTYETKAAVLKWAQRAADDHIRRGRIIIAPSKRTSKRSRRAA